MVSGVEWSGVEWWCLTLEISAISCVHPALNRTVRITSSEDDNVRPTLIY